MDFWVEDKIEVAHRIAQRLGPIGKYNEKGKHYVVSTAEYGKIWYGDIDIKSDMRTLKNIALTLKSNLILEHEVEPTEIAYDG